MFLQIVSVYVLTFIERSCCDQALVLNGEGRGSWMWLVPGFEVNSENVSVCRAFAWLQEDGGFPTVEIE